MGDVDRMTPESHTTVLVCGSRSWTDKDWIADVMADLVTLPNVEIIHGGARGADQLAGEVAKMIYGFPIRVFRPDYERHGRSWAPKQRNLDMLTERPNLVLAFQCNGSSGTQHTIDQARRRGISVQVYTKDDAA